MNHVRLEKATICNLDRKGPAIRVLFNPKEYSVSKQNSWKVSANTTDNSGELQFGGGQPDTLQLQLFFDTYASGTGSGGSYKDVRREHTDAIYSLMLIDEGLKDKKSRRGRPPRVRFQWGSAWLFEAVITSIRQTFTLFGPDGTPLRAVLDVTFQQARDETHMPPTNPTSGGDGGERVWTVSPGESLAWIAYREYGSPNEWRRIADANHLLNVRRLAPGIVLMIPND